jgi:hypothetical protein
MIDCRLLKDYCEFRSANVCPCARGCHFGESCKKIIDATGFPGKLPCELSVEELEKILGE